MALEIPELEVLQGRLFTDLVANLNQPQAACSTSILNAFSKSFGYQLWAAYQYSDNLGYTPLDATGKKLEEFATICGITRLVATYASGYITSLSTGTIPNGTTLVRCDGVRFEVLEETVSPSDKIPVIALDIGTCGNTFNGVRLTFDSAIVGISPDAIVSTDTIAGGSEIETDDQFRQRIILCLSSACRSGTVSDYDYWTRLYNGVTSVQVVPLFQGCGSVKVCFAMQNSYLDGIPTQQDVENVQQILADNIPLGVKVRACAASANIIDISIKLLNSTTLSQREEIVSGLKETFSISPIGNFCISDIYSSIDRTYNNCFEIVEPSGPVQIDPCSIPVLGTVKFVR